MTISSTTIVNQLSYHSLFHRQLLLSAINNVCTQEDDATPNSYACGDHLEPKNQINIRSSKNIEQVQLRTRRTNITSLLEKTMTRTLMTRIIPEIVVFIWNKQHMYTSLAFTGKAEQIGPALTHRNVNLRTNLHDPPEHELNEKEWFKSLNNETGT